ncbi:MAG TPA: GGDEF domain-containing protein [Candidatus Binatia bacterium]|nr:GGDEF domain-containing protein [Candidatus Binatia bacterium]
MSAASPTPPSRPGAGGEPSIRRTWWLLAGSFFLLALVSGIRLVTEQAAVDWLTVILVVIAAIAAIAHRNAVAGLEARGRGEAEGFARILRSLSRSVSADAIVSAILDDLVDATDADHVVLVRRRRDASALEATLVTRRPGVPTTSTILPRSLLESAALAGPKPAVAIPIVTSAPVAVAAGADAAPAPERPGTTSSRPETDDDRPADANADTAETPSASADTADAVDRPIVLPRVARRASDPAGGRTLLRRAAAEGLALLGDIGLPTRNLPGMRGRARPSEVLARGDEAVIVERVADRVRAVFGLSHTLSAPLRSGERGIVGAVVLSRRAREAWPESARRLLRGAAAETATALERADSFRAAEESASTDPLTGLPNRRYFDEFATLLSARRRKGDAVAVLMIDIDRFKVLNDTYGHPVGDEVLKAVANAITSAVRDQDVPARMGGEEFAVLLRNPGPDVAREIGERVRRAVRDLDLADLGVPGVSVSVGVANATGPDEPIHALVDRADRALLRAKRAGRDRVVGG